MNRITDDLWIGDIDDARESSLNGVDLVVTVCQDEVSDNVSADYEFFNMSDGETDQYGGDASYELFAEACEAVLGALERGERVFVHCHVGRSRSVAVCTAVLGVRADERYDDAFWTVRQARPIANPNPVLEAKARRFINERRHTP